MVVAPPRKPPYSVDDLDDFPVDGNRYELIHGDLHVSAAPAHLHQRATVNLTTGLGVIKPAGFEVLAGPVDLVLDRRTVVEPDVVVIAAGPLRGKRIEERPTLVVEVLSPSNRLYDLGTKRLIYGEAGVPVLWIVDPAEPSITAWRWQDGAETIARATGDEVFRADVPFPLALNPNSLIELDGWRTFTSG